MPSAPENRRRKEYLAILQAGGEVQYEPKTETNRRILAEVRAEVQQAKRKIQQEAEQGSKKIKFATDEGVRQIDEAKNQALREISATVTLAALASASSSTTAEHLDMNKQEIAPAPRPETSATEQGEEQAPQKEKEADEDMVDNGRVPASDLEELHIAEQEAEKQSLDEAAPSKSTAEVEEGQFKSSAAQESTGAITAGGLHKLRTGADEPAPAPAADAPEWTSESDDASASGEEDEVDKAEGEERVAQTAVDRDVAPLTPAVATMSQALVPLSQEAARTPWELLCEANEQRHRATTEERARLAPDLTQHLRRTYDRLAVQNGWPALADAAALPDEITASAEWFFEMKSPFQNALKERRGEAVTRALTRMLQRHRSKCWACQGGDPRDVDPACALHRALSAVDEVRLEMALRAAWAEEALTYAVDTCRQRAAAAEQARLASLAREEEDSVERERRYAAEQRARQMLRPKASKCAACAEADWVYGGLCRAHQEELETLCETL